MRKSILYIIGWIVFIIIWCGLVMYIPNIINFAPVDKSTFIGCMESVFRMFGFFVYALIALSTPILSCLYMIYLIFVDIFKNDIKNNWRNKNV